MLKESDIEYLNRYRVILETVPSIIRERDAKILELLTAGESPTELAKVSGLTRARIYQLKNASTRAQ